MNSRITQMTAALAMVLAFAASAKTDVTHVSIDLAKIQPDQIVGDGLSAPQTIDETACRVVAKGRIGQFVVLGWWGKTVRPPRGQMYLATVRYKDTVPKPARFLAFAGLSRYDRPTVMHHFGGLGDGKWKTARIPLAWDMLMLAPGKDHTALAIQSPAGDLPVASVSIGPIDSDAEKRYNIETRRRVSRAQHKPAKPMVKIAKPQKALIPPELANQVIVPYVRSYMSVIYPYSAPQKGEAGGPLHVRMALNEYEPAVFAVYAPKKNLTNVTCRLGPLTGPAGTLTVNVEYRTAEYCLVQHSARRRGPGGLAVFPQRLWPAYPVDIAKGESHWLWITLQTDPAKSKPGKYHGLITVLTDQGQAELPISVEVLPIRLLTMDQAGLLMGGCHPGLMPAHEMEVLGKYNFNMYNIWFSIAPEMTIIDGKMHLDFRRLDDWMKTAADSGLKAMVWFLGGNPYGYPRTLSIEREIYIALHAAGNQDSELHTKLYNQFIKSAASEQNRGKVLPEVVPYYRQWVSRVWKYSRENGWPELIMTPFDEPAKWVQGPYRKSTETHPDVIGAGPWIKDHFKHACRILHDSAPEMRVYGSIHHNHVLTADGKRPKSEFPAVGEGEIFIEDVECFCTNAIHEDPNLGNKVRAAGKDFWQYSGCSGASGLPDRARFTFGFFFSAFDSRGSLVWAYDWPGQFDTTSGSHWQFAWRTPFDVIPAPYYEAMREAWDDRRYVETLKALAKEKKVDISDFLARLATTAIELRGAGGRDTVHDFWAQPSDLGAIDQMRERVIAKTRELQK